MDYNTLEVLISQLSEQTGSQYGITWQGGEPALAGIDFYKKAIELQLKYGKTKAKTIGNSLQTNGTLLNDEWIEFLKQYNFLVGLSLDGPEPLHNQFRKFSNDKGSWDKVLPNGQKLLKASVAVNILSCVSKANSKRAAELYSFYKSEGYTWLQYIPIYEVDEKGKTQDFSVNNDQLARFYVRLLICGLLIL